MAIIYIQKIPSEIFLEIIYKWLPWHYGHTDGQRRR